MWARLSPYVTVPNAIAGVLFLVLLVWLATRAEGCRSAWLDSRTDRKVAELAERTAKAESAAAEAKGRADAMETELEQVRRTLEEQSREIEALANRAEREDAAVRSSGQRYRQARRGAVPATDADTERRLRSLYPE
jgi:chromosome segregation ATPase